LRESPDRQGKPLLADLAGYRSLRVVGQRYRVLYRVDPQQVTVFVVAAGIRRGGAKSDISRSRES
jgi:mRNA interferase RelE/StbE